jgi:hypothetical protein
MLRSLPSSWKKARPPLSNRLTLLATVCIVLMAVGARASTPPRQLYGKGIRIEYTVATTVESERGPRDVVSSISRTIYVSSTGRLFERAVWSNKTGTKVSDNSPDASTNRSGEARGMSFHGTSLVAHIGYALGAGQMTIRFNPSFSSCEGQAIYGTGGERKMARRGIGGSVRRILSIKATDVRCSLTSDNPFQ